MHTFGDTGTGVPAFLAKLWRLVDDKETDRLICWSKDGRSFIIQNQAQFARELLPLNYKHNNMASFIRQLNMYGFHKITSIDNGGLKFDRDEMEFSHPCFKRNCPYLLEHIKRKIANTKSLDEKSSSKPEAVSKVLQDVKAMRGRQDSLDSRFTVMKQENEALWREIASLRQKHAKQQQIVNKLIQFLITIVQPSRNMTSVKRHMQLMINDTPENARLRKSSETESDCGPVIHELTEELLDEVADTDSEIMDPNSPYARLTHIQQDSPSPLNVERPHSRISVNSQSYEYSNQSIEDFANTAGCTPSNHNCGNGSASPASSIIKSVNPDGSHIVYHVTEVPEGHPGESNASPVPIHFIEENVLTTPMVREEIARSQLLKEKNKQRRKQAKNGAADDAVTSAAINAAKVPRLSPNQQQQTPPTVSISFTAPDGQIVDLSAGKVPNIKCEDGTIDPMLFLNAYPDARLLTPESPMASPNFNEDSSQSFGGLTASAVTPGIMTTNTTSINPTPSNDELLLNTPTTSNLFDPNDFIATDIPTDLFEEPLLSGDNITFNDNCEAEQQQNFGQLTATNGKFSSFIASSRNGSVGGVGDVVAGTVNNNIGASTSAAAAAAGAAISVPSPSTFLTSAAPANSGSSSAVDDAAAQDQNDQNMALAKYKNAGCVVTGNGPNDNVMRNEVSGHLDNMQDELESLKDLLRGEGYSLDANTLLGLFNDSDILSPYGLPFPSENSNDKKGSELMTYQPIFDLSDILDMNSNADMDADADGVASPGSTFSMASSTLNTPRHD